MARIKRFNPETSAWEYADEAFVSGGGGLRGFSNEVDVIPLQDLPATGFNETYQRFSTGLIPAPSALVVGETYYVLWEGEIYPCVGQDASAILPNAVAIGNGAAFEAYGMKGNNEPFLIGVPADMSGVMFLSLVDTESKVYTVHVYQMVDKILQVVDNEVKAVPLAESAIATFIDNYIEEALGGDY